MEDPLIGGYGKDKLALRRAIAMSYNSAEDIAQMKKGLAVRAVTPLPPSWFRTSSPSPGAMP